MANRNLSTFENPKSPISEAFRTLRTNIQFANIDKEIKSIVFTSSGPGEGKSSIISNLAVTMSQIGKKVLLIDCDLRKPRMHKIFHIPVNEGLTNILALNEDYKKIVKKTEIEGLDIIPSGPIPPNPSEILGSNKMKEFMKKVKEGYDMVLLDTPPVGVVTDAAILSTIVDGTIIVCAVGQAIRDAAINTKVQLERVNANILGVVLNKVPIKEGGYYKYHYYNYYSSYYEDSKEDKKSKRRRKK